MNYMQDSYEFFRDKLKEVEQGKKFLKNHNNIREWALHSTLPGMHRVACHYLPHSERGPWFRSTPLESLRAIVADLHKRTKGITSKPIKLLLT